MAAFLTDHPIPAINQELDRLEAAARDALGANADDYEIEPSALLRRQIAQAQEGSRVATGVVHQGRQIVATLHLEEEQVRDLLAYLQGTEQVPLPEPDD